MKKLLFVLTLTVLTAVAPAFAESRTHTSGAAHMRPQLFHDRSPRLHTRTPQAHHTS